MKKLNRKGFTLIELLAIIVILAIIMVVTIPTVLGSLADARRNTFQNAVNAVAEWAEKQYTLASYGDSGVDPVFAKYCGANGNECAGTSMKTQNTLTNPGTTALDSQTSAQLAYSFLKAAGAKVSNFTGMDIQIVNGRACVYLYNNTTSGDFSSVKPETGDTKGKNGLYFTDGSGTEAVSGSYDSTDTAINMHSSGC